MSATPVDTRFRPNFAALPDETTIVGDLEDWATRYLDTGQAARDWTRLMVRWRRRYANYVVTGNTWGGESDDIQTGRLDASAS